MVLPFSSTPAAQDEPEVVYPESDGRPLGETGFHVEALIFLHQALKRHLKERPDAYVASDMFLYYERGNPRANKSPDVMVILGIDNHTRRTFKTWVENAVPTVIFEISSDETWREDFYGKRELYARLGVAEYFLFDPLGDCLDPRLQGFRLEDGTDVYTLLPFAPDGSLECRALGLRLVSEDQMIRLIDARTNRPIPTEEELARDRERERKRAEQEKRRANREKRRADEQELQAEREKQRAERAGKKADREKQRAEAQAQQTERERQRAEAQAQQAERERQRADALEAEIARLRALLDRGSDPKGE
jgi:Uma2 family endonuclease